MTGDRIIPHTGSTSIHYLDQRPPCPYPVFFSPAMIDPHLSCPDIPVFSNHVVTRVMNFVSLSFAKCVSGVAWFHLSVDVVLSTLFTRTSSINWFARRHWDPAYATVCNLQVKMTKYLRCAASDTATGVRWHVSKIFARQRSESPSQRCRPSCHMSHTLLPRWA